MDFYQIVDYFFFQISSNPTFILSFILRYIYIKLSFQDKWLITINKWIQLTKKYSSNHYWHPNISIITKNKHFHQIKQNYQHQHNRIFDYIIQFFKAIMEGTLQVWEGMFMRWKQYSVKIQDDILIFTKDNITIDFKVHLKVAQVITNVDNPICFILHTGTQTMNIRANSIQERVKWYKQIKHIQKQSENAKYNKQKFQLDKELGNTKKTKVLEQITIQLWKLHAELQNTLSDLKNMGKVPHHLKKSFDKLRMTTQNIKFKNSEALQLIEEYYKDMKNKRQYGFNQLPNEFQNQDFNPNQTKFLSFEEDFKKKRSSNFLEDSQIGGFHSQIPQRKDQTMFHSFNNGFDNRQFDKSRDYSFKDFGEGDMQGSGALIKANLFRQNQLYRQIKSFLSSNKSHRYSLPQKFTPQEKFSILSILTSAIGQDITKISLPVTINQPISVLQKACEKMYYSQLLDKADSQSDPVTKMLYVAAFVVSQYSLSQERTKKPFNPLLGQTFQYQDQQRKFIFLSEQVSHHPPISATYCRSDTFYLVDDSRSKSTFTGTSIKITPQSKTKLILQSEKDQYLWDKAIMHLNGLVMGKVYVQITGKVIIKCQKNQTEARLTFKQSGILRSSDLNVVQGQIFYQKQKQYDLTGKWNEVLIASSSKGRQTKTLWHKTHHRNKDYYNFNDMTFQLNHINKTLLQMIPPTDSRLRPDQRALQFQKLDIAARQKNRLENKQRERRKQYQQLGKTHQPLWFSLTNGFYESNQKYLVEKRNGKWPKCLDIY